MTNFVIIAVMRRSGALRITRWPFDYTSETVGSRRKMFVEPIFTQPVGVSPCYLVTITGGTQSKPLTIG